MVWFIKMRGLEPVLELCHFLGMTLQWHNASRGLQWDAHSVSLYTVTEEVEFTKTDIFVAYRRLTLGTFVTSYPSLCPYNASVSFNLFELQSLNL